MHKTLQAVLLAVIAGQNASALSAPPDSFRDLAEKHADAVVTITVSRSSLRVLGAKVVEALDPLPLRNLIPDYVSLAFGLVSTVVYPLNRKTLGSGFIISEDGLIATNCHVVENPGRITVEVRSDRKRHPARVLGTDPRTDLALIQFEESGRYPFLKLGDSDELRQGDWLVAFGAPLGFKGSMTAGTVSAKGRRIGLIEIEDFIQTDAAVNFGNSGGPVLNVRGEVVGIVTAGLPLVQGLGFAIPINELKNSLAALRQGKEPVWGWLGVKIRDAERSGAEVTKVYGGSPAAAAGVEPGDVFLKWNETEICEAQDLFRSVLASSPDSIAGAVVRRGGRELKLSISVGRRKEPTRIF